MNTHKAVRGAPGLAQDTFLNTFSATRRLPVSRTSLLVMTSSILELMTDVAYGARITREIWGMLQLAITELPQGDPSCSRVFFPSTVPPRHVPISFVVSETAL